MALNDVIGTIWALTLEEELQKALVFGSDRVVNRKYEGVLRGVGSTVRIPSIARGTVQDYIADTDTAAPAALNDAAVNLIINRARYVSVYVDDLDMAMSPYDIVAAAARGNAYALADDADQYIASQMVADAAPANYVGTSTTPIDINASSSNNSYSVLVQLAARLDAANVPRQGRWVVVSPRFLERLLLHQYCVFTASQVSQDSLAGGYVTQIAGFAVLVSNNIPEPASPATWRRILAGVPDATTFAAAVQSTETYRPERRFGTGVKSLYSYGVKVTRPDALAMAFVTYS